MHRLFVLPKEAVNVIIATADAAAGNAGGSGCGGNLGMNVAMVMLGGQQMRT